MELNAMVICQDLQRRVNLPYILLHFVIFLCCCDAMAKHTKDETRTPRATRKEKLECRLRGEKAKTHIRS